MGPEQNTTAVYERALSAGLAMDAVTLRVGDLEQMSGYYEQRSCSPPSRSAPGAPRCIASSGAATCRWCG